MLVQGFLGRGGSRYMIVWVGGGVVSRFLELSRYIGK